MSREESVALGWKGYVGFALKCNMFRVFSLLYTPPSFLVGLEGTVWFAFLSASTVCFSLRKKLGEFKQLKDLSFDLATSRIFIGHIQHE